MSAYAQQYYHNYYYQNHLDSNKQHSYYRKDKEYFRQQPFFPSYYSRQANYQTTFFANPNYASTTFHQYGIPNPRLGSSYQYDDRYRSQYTWPYFKKKNNHQWKSPDSAFPLATYSRSYPSNYNAGPVYQFEREVRYFPYPVYGDPGISSYTSNRSLRYPNLSRYPYPSLGNRNYSNYQNISQLPPKIRVIFIPPSSSCPQQPCNVTPAMPPFLFNRMSQPLCSLPLPPPLPQISSLPLTPGTQQMVMQKYSNPVAILPFTSNYQSGQSFAPNYSFPPVVPQQPLTMPTPVAPPCQYAPQSYAAPALPSNNVPVSSYNAFSPPTYPTVDASMSQPSNSSYPSTCRACVPAPPPLNIPVTSHCWMQHCSACHHVPGDASNPNVRPDNHGRMTPLLRQPTVAQHVQDANNDYQHYPHVNTYSADGSKLNNLPPLPPGAVIISDEYIPRNDLVATQQYNQRYPVEHPRVENSVPRSEAYSTFSTSKSQNSREVTKKSNRKKLSNSRTPPYRDLSNMKTSPPRSYARDNRPSLNSSTVSISKLSKSSADTNTANYVANTEQKLADKQFTAMARMINLRYRHQTPDLQAIYHSNEQSKSSDDDDDRTSIATSNTKSSLFLPRKNHHFNRPQSIAFDSQAENEKKSIPNRPFISYRSERHEGRTGTLKRLRRISSMTNSASSLDTTSATINKDRGSVSPTTTTKTD
ncbi:hypothetical protein I4U23_026629 [Adineta vaga]|nr:hypothetical protein I4U23_026629 [Adineta vaga]